MERHGTKFPSATRYRTTCCSAIGQSTRKLTKHQYFLSNLLFCRRYSTKQRRTYIVNVSVIFDINMMMHCVINDSDSTLQRSLTISCSMAFNFWCSSSHLNDSILLVVWNCSSSISIWQHQTEQSCACDSAWRDRTRFNVVNGSRTAREKLGLNSIPI